MMSESTVSGSSVAQSSESAADEPAVAIGWPRFSLRSLLLLTTAVSLFFAQVPWFGDVYVYAMAFSLGLIFVMWLLMFRAGYGVALAVSFPIAVVGLFSVFGSMTFFFHTLCNVVAAFLCLSFSPKPRMALAVLGTAMLIPYAWMMNNGLAELREYDQLRLAYPLVSLENRMVDLENHAWEQGPEVILAGAVEQALDEQVQRVMYGNFPRYRPMALRLLHDDTERRFIAAQGFGFSRMPSHFSPRLIELEPISTAALPMAVGLGDVNNPDYMHAGIIHDFTNAERTGYVRSLKAVAGFEGHAITGLRDAVSDEKPFTAWQLTQLQLVSLLRHKEPVAYKTESLPQMEEISEYRHRPLNEFEANALPKLRAEQDTVVKKDENVIRMLGSIRADKNCLACHSGQRGDLLGAFSYVLEKTLKQQFDQSVGE